VGLFAFKFSFSRRIFCLLPRLGVVSSDSKMAHKFFLVRGYTRYFGIVYVYYLLLRILPRKMAPNFYHVHKSSGESSIEPRTRTGQCPSSMLFRQTSICMSAIMSSWYGATTEAAESHHSQSKLTTPRRENRKI
jgi:hypothetical protein